MDPTKPGITTTEFWLAVFTTIAPLVAFFFHGTFNISGHVQDFAVLAAAISAAAYAIGRSLVKLGALWRASHVPPQ